MPHSQRLVKQPNLMTWLKRDANIEIKKSKAVQILGVEKGCKNQTTTLDDVRLDLLDTLSGYKWNVVQ